MRWLFLTPESALLEKIDELISHLKTSEEFPGKEAIKTALVDAKKELLKPQPRLYTPTQLSDIQNSLTIIKQKTEEYIRITTEQAETGNFLATKIRRSKRSEEALKNFLHSEFEYEPEADASDDEKDVETVSEELSRFIKVFVTYFASLDSDNTTKLRDELQLRWSELAALHNVYDQRKFDDQVERLDSLLETLIKKILDVQKQHKQKKNDFGILNFLEEIGNEPVKLRETLEEAIAQNEKNLHDFFNKVKHVLPQHMLEKVGDIVASGSLETEFEESSEASTTE